MMHMIYRYDTYDTHDTYMHIMHLGVFQLFTPQNLHLQKLVFFRNPLDDIYLPRGFPRLEKVSFDECLSFYFENNNNFEDVLDNLGIFQLSTPENVHLQKRFSFLESSR